MNRKGCWNGFRAAVHSASAAAPNVSQALLAGGVSREAACRLRLLYYRGADFEQKDAPVTFKHIIYEPGPVARIILNRPKYRNAQSRVMIEEMDRAFIAATEDDTVKVIVLSGQGDHFSAGHDLGTPEEIADREARGGLPDNLGGRYARSWEMFVAATMRWRNVPKPTIAMVQGYCIFGGFMFASSMDLVFAADNAMFLPNHTQYFPLPWDIGPRKAKELLYESRFMPAAEALDLGFVNRLYPAADLERETLAFAERVAANDSFFLRMVKFSVNNMEDAKGFSHTVEAAFNVYQLSSMPQKSFPPAGGERPGPRRLGGVQRAMELLEGGIPRGARKL
ncbi:enoyl-CoA hydratase-related protein [Candidatus Amarobacter glycogenicus]|uniref:enoyl-CoA hydratase-related protein n=1 Tax=Candidatus Amarobacter glycogenicus TaxID=3140699 RepID=UPI003136E700|nr:enoyl-CoA hydratase/isomerase family protein [Dehalococcoidia bacterium]